jgi:hypothetical protein
VEINTEIRKTQRHLMTLKQTEQNTNNARTKKQENTRISWKEKIAYWLKNKVTMKHKSEIKWDLG